MWDSKKTWTVTLYSKNILHMERKIMKIYEGEVFSKVCCQNDLTVNVI